MKTLVLLIFLFLHCINLKSQVEEGNNKTTWYWFLGFGAGFPLGEFANDELGNATFANGLIANLGVAFWNSPVGTMGMCLQISSNSYYCHDDAPFISQQNNLAAMQGYDGQFETFVIGNENSYSDYNLVAGFLLRKSINKFSLDAKILAGLNTIDRSGSQIVSTNDSLNAIYFGYQNLYAQDYSISHSFVYDIGAGIRYIIGKKQNAFLTFDCDFAFAEGNFSMITSSQYIDGSGTIVFGDHEENISFGIPTVKLNLGIGWILGRKDNS